jgi:hypothetical protein
MQRRARRGFPIADQNSGDRPSAPSEEKHWMSEHAIAIAPPAGADAAEARTLSLSALSWIGYEATRIPYLILIKIYIFAPYVVKVMIGDPVLGQTTFARYGFVTGLIGEMTVPFLGAALDRMGPRKPWITVFILASLPLLGPVENRSSSLLQGILTLLKSARNTPSSAASRGRATSRAECTTVGYL